MSALEKDELEPIRRLGVIAGGGALPWRLLEACDRRNIEPFIVAFEGHTDPDLIKGRNYLLTRFGAAGQIVETLKAHDVHNLVLIGSIRRPSLSELRPDFKALEFFARIGFKAFGDSDVLSIMREALEEEGFKVHGIQKFAADLLAQLGILGKHKPKKDDWIDIRRGLEISQNLGDLDVGQSVIVQEGIVLGVEAAEGTDELIRRCKYLRRKGRRGVLVKTCKPGQDRDLDLPTIGPQTIENVAECGLGGVVVHALQTLIVDPEEVTEIADKHKIFVMAVDPLKELFES